jgi:hypothetical protein
MCYIIYNKSFMNYWYKLAKCVLKAKVLRLRLFNFNIKEVIYKVIQQFYRVW